MEDGIDRRHLLLGAGGAALMAGVAPARSAAQAPSRKLGYAMVGLGNYATNIIMPQFANCQHSQVTALVSGTPEKLRKFGAQYGVPDRSQYNYQNFDKIRDNPDVDIVYVVLPNSMHAEYTIRAAQAGKHVMCEKPMANSVAECEAMIAACKKAGKKLMIGYRCHFEAHNLYAIELVKQGRIGKPRTVQSEHGFSIQPGVWRLNKALAGGGSMMDIGIYSLNAMRYMTGEEPTSVNARWSTDRTDPRFSEVEDRILWTLTFPSGVIGNGVSSYSSGHNHIRITGDKGWIDIEPGTPYDGHRMKVGSYYNGDPVEPPPGPGVNQFVGQLDHLSQCIKENRDNRAAGEEGLRDIRIIMAMYQSAADNGRTIQL